MVENSVLFPFHPDVEVVVVEDEKYYSEAFLFIQILVLFLGFEQQLKRFHVDDTGDDDDDDDITSFVSAAVQQQGMPQWAFAFATLALIAVLFS